MRSLIIIAMLGLCMTCSCRHAGPRAGSSGTALRFLGLRTASYAAPNLDELKAWYTEVLGFGPYFDEPFYVGFNVGGYELALDPDGKVGEGVVVYWGVEDIDAEYQRLIQLGAKPHKPIENVGGDLRVAVVLDPAGNQFGMIYNPAFELP